MTKRRIWLVMMTLAAVLAVGACNGNGGEEDTGTSEQDTGQQDTGQQDTGEPGDTGQADAGDVPGDTGGQDTGSDTGGEDTGGSDTGGDDTGTADTGGGDTSDAGPAFQEVECPDSPDLEISIVSAVDGYDPASATPKVGDVVQWTNNDSIQHTVTEGTPGSGSSAFDSGKFGEGETYCLKFLQEKQWDYYCTVHPNMTGSVDVQP